VAVASLAAVASHEAAPFAAAHAGRSAAAAGAAIQTAAPARAPARRPRSRVGILLPLLITSSGATSGYYAALFLGRSDALVWCTAGAALGLLLGWAVARSAAPRPANP
jgi:hypothetical protein